MCILDRLNIVITGGEKERGRNATRYGMIGGHVGRSFSPSLKPHRLLCCRESSVCQTLENVTAKALTKPNISLNPIIIPGYNMYLSRSCLICTKGILQIPTISLLLTADRSVWLANNLDQVAGVFSRKGLWKKTCMTPLLYCYKKRCVLDCAVWNIICVVTQLI